MALLSAKPVTFVMTRNRAAAKAFYQDSLGLRLLSEDPAAVVFDLAGTPLRVTEDETCTSSMHPVLGWHVGDIVATVEALRAKGVAFEIYEGMGQDALGIWSSPDGSMRVAFFKDPDGNVLTVSQ
eukprot:c246_g1_i1.p3 GENE.c246_g1_i1~~c246_g1_i1.p3  ORF type:complete len:138 (+),score=33.00 c246_g1_i1:41-415(+)